MPSGSREALWSVFYIGVAIVFGIVFSAWAGGEFGAQYFAGYIVEKTLSIDNLFVFVIIMAAFAVPQYQQKLLIIGIAIALVLRAIFIAVGATLLAYFSFMFLVFGILLIWTGIAVPTPGRGIPTSATTSWSQVPARCCGPLTSTTRAGSSSGSTAAAWPRRCSSGSSPSAPLDLLFALDSIPQCSA